MKKNGKKKNGKKNGAVLDAGTALATDSCIYCGEPLGGKNVCPNCGKDQVAIVDTNAMPVLDAAAIAAAAEAEEAAARLKAAEEAAARLVAEEAKRAEEEVAAKLKEDEEAAARLVAEEAKRAEEEEAAAKLAEEELKRMAAEAVAAAGKKLDETEEVEADFFVRGEVMSGKEARIADDTARVQAALDAADKAGDAEYDAMSAPKPEFIVESKPELKPKPKPDVNAPTDEELRAAGLATKPEATVDVPMWAIAVLGIVAVICIAVAATVG